MPQILNKISVFILILSSIAIFIAFVLFAITSFIILIPGLFLYFLSIRAGFKNLNSSFKSGFNKTSNKDGKEEFDEDGLKIVNDSGDDKDRAGNNSYEENIFQKYGKSAAKKIKNICEKYTD